MSEDTQPKDGGPAHPCGILDAGNYKVPMNYGMSLRDYFAGQALAGILASPKLSPKAGPGVLVKAAYDYADVMLTVRKQ